MQRPGYRVICLWARALPGLGVWGLGECVPGLSKELSSLTLNQKLLGSFPLLSKDLNSAVILRSSNLPH